MRASDGLEVVWHRVPALWASIAILFLVLFLGWFATTRGRDSGPSTQAPTGEASTPTAKQPSQVIAGLRPEAGVRAQPEDGASHPLVSPPPKQRMGDPQPPEVASVPSSAPPRGSSHSEAAGLATPKTVSRSVDQVPASYELQLTALGTTIEPSRTYGVNDPRFSSGSNLLVSVQYEGAVPGHTELIIEWFVGQYAVSLFEKVTLKDSSGLWSRTYNNATVAKGQHRIVLKVDGIPMRELQFRLE